MKNIYKTTILSLSLIASQFLSINVTADTALHFKNTPQQNNNSNNTIYIKDGKIRFSDSGGQSREYSIFDSNKNKLIHISPSQHSYIEIDPDTMNQQMSAVKQQMEMMMSQMQQQMKNMPPEQRQMMEKMMSQQMNGTNPAIPGMPQAPKIEQIKTDKTEIIAGVKCELINIRSRKLINEELCIANESQFSIDSEDKQALKQMIEFFKELSQKSGSIMGINSMANQFDGVPIRTREYNNVGKLVSESILSTISKNKVSSDVVSIPLTYTKQTLY